MSLIERATAARAEASERIAADRAAEAMQRARDLLGLLGIEYPHVHTTPDLRSEGVGFLLGVDRRGFACLPVDLACPVCGRHYGDLQIDNRTGLVKVLAREFEHSCAEYGRVVRVTGLAPPGGVGQ